MPFRPIQTTYAAGRRRVVAILGDSFTNNPSYGVDQGAMWGEVLGAKLRALGASVRVGSFGVAGQTSSQVQARAKDILTLGKPDLAFIEAGANDYAASPAVPGLASSTVSASPAPTTTTFTVASATGFVTGSPVYVGPNGVTQAFSTITAIASNAITVSPALPVPPAVGVTVTQGTQANLQYLIWYTLNAGCSRIIVPTTHFLNFSTAGDTLATPYATYATLRPFQVAAAAAFASSNPGQVVSNDTYTYWRNIIANTPTGNNQVVFNGVLYTINANADSTPSPVGGGYSYHVADGNQHLNALGNEYAARGALLEIQAQGWVSPLTK